MKELSLYFNEPAEVAAHLEQLLLTLVSSPFFAGLPAEDRSRMVGQHLALIRAHSGPVWP